MLSIRFPGIKVYRGDFQGTPTLVRAPRAQAKKIENKNLGFSRGTYQTTAWHSVRWDLFLHSFAAWSDQAQLDWLSRTAPRRPLLRPPLYPTAAAPSSASTPSPPCSGGLLESAPGGSLSRTADAAGKDTLAPTPPRPICRPRLRSAGTVELEDRKSVV